MLTPDSALTAFFVEELGVGVADLLGPAEGVACASRSSEVMEAALLPLLRRLAGAGESSLSELEAWKSQPFGQS